MYNNPYINNLSLNERIDNEIERLKQMKTQVQQPVQPITQNFQLAPSTGIKYANTLDDVKKEMVYIDTPFFSKDFSVMWLKTAKGEIKPYELTEMITKDEKDIRIEYLQASQTAQNSFIAQGFANEVDQLYNRLSNCPVPSTPVYGRTPIFTCNNNGCGCNGYNQLF